MKKKLFPLLVLAFLLLTGLTASAAGGDPYLEYQTNLTQIGWNAAWDAGYDGAGVTIALIDSGVYSRHEDLSGANLLPAVDLVTRGAFAAPEDSIGHGTFIAGMLSAVRGNGIGIAGMVDGAALRSFKCYTTEDETEAQPVVSAIYAAVDDYGCDIINLSLGVEEDVPSLRAAVEHAAEAGVIVIAAVGNDGTEALSWPAAYDCVVGVGAVDGAGAVSYFSQRNSSVFVVAPGEGIVSTGNSRRAYFQWDGTSFACVHATALAAVAKQYDPDIDVWRFMELLKGSALDLGPAGYDTGYGWGLVDAGAFLRALSASMPEPAPEPEPEPEPPAAEVRFTDISGHWAEPYIVEAVSRGLFAGMTETEFWPDYGVTRAMAAALLYRLAGSPEFADPGWRFADVAADAWYTRAVAWTVQMGVFNGDSDGLFHPERGLTRQEFAAVLHRFARWQGRDASVAAPAAFADAGLIADWARDAAAWCAEKGYITGRPGGLFDPEAGVTRAETAAILIRYTGTV